MSGKDDDKDAGYEPVVGFSIPFNRVLGHEERSENPDGSRSGSLFMTIEGCTFQHDGLKGSVAATVGAPSVVVEIVGEERDYLTSSRTSSRYVVDAHDVVDATMSAHKARMTGIVTPNVDAVLRRLARLVWVKVGEARNPLLNQALSSEQGDRFASERFSTWNTAQLELGRALFQVVFNGGAPDLGLINRALDFLES